MIRTKKELEFYIMADRMMNKGYFKPSFLQKVRDIIMPDYIMRYIEVLRKYSFYARGGKILYSSDILSLSA